MSLLVALVNPFTFAYQQVQTANVALPGNGSPQYALVIPPDSVTIYTGPQTGPTKNVYVTFIAETGTPEVYITPGEGL
jgi:hypothetical protein